MSVYITWNSESSVLTVTWFALKMNTQHLILALLKHYTCRMKRQDVFYRILIYLGPDTGATMCCGNGGTKLAMGGHQCLGENTLDA